MDAIINNFFNYRAFDASAALLWLGTVNLLRLVAMSFIVALLLGLFFAAIRLSPWVWLHSAQIWFIDTVRAMPPLVSLMVVFYLVPTIGGVSFDTFSAAVMTFGIIQGAYVGEIYRGGLVAIPRGQHDAAAALGLDLYSHARYIVAPQVLRVVIPPLTSQLTQLVRDSSLTFFIGYEEVISRAKQAVALTSNSTPYTVAVGIYAVLLISMQIVSTYLEKRRLAPA